MAFGRNDDGTVRLMRHNGAAEVGYERTVGSVPSTTTANGFRATVPLASLGDDGRMTFRVTATSRLDPPFFTGILDFMPDPGLAPGVVR